MIHEIKPVDALAMQKNGAVIVDVREPWELAVASIPNTLNISMNTIPNRLEDLIELATLKPVLILCHHGRRSLNVAHFLDTHNIGNIYNITGGCDAWSLDVDIQLPRY